MVIFLLARRSLHGLSPSICKIFGYRQAIAGFSSQRQKFFASERRLAKWDEIFFESSTKDDEIERSCHIPPKRGFSVNEDEEYGGYNYHPEDDDNMNDSFPSEEYNDVPDIDNIDLSVAKVQASSYIPEMQPTTFTNTTILKTDREMNIQTKSQVEPRASNFPSRQLHKKLERSDFPSETSGAEIKRGKRIDLGAPPGREDLLKVYSGNNNGRSLGISLAEREKRLEILAKRIYDEYNDGQEINLNSYKQVSNLLYGTTNKQSTNKHALETLAGCNNIQIANLARLILEYRKEKSSINRSQKKEKNILSGKAVSTFAKSTCASQTNDNDPLILIDASTFIFRAYYSMPPLHRQDGMPTGAVLGFCNMLNQMVLNQILEASLTDNVESNSKRSLPRIILVFDAKGKTFRHDMYPDYKANRVDCPADLIPQFDLIHDAAKAYGIPEVEATGYEADDVIATLATLALSQGLDTHIISTDKDLMQLVTSKEAESSNYIHMINPTKMSLIDSEVVADKWNVSHPEMIGDILALAGDTSDNVPGVPGIGPKTAASLLNEYGTLEKIYENVGSIKQKKRRELLVEHKDKAFISRQLVELKRCISFENMTGTVKTLDDARVKPLDGERLLEFYKRMEFNSIRRKVQDRIMQHRKKQIPKPEDYKDVPF